MGEPNHSMPSHSITDKGDKIVIHDLELFVGHIDGFDDDESDIKDLDSEAIDSIITKTKRHMSAGANPKLVLMHQNDNGSTPTESIGDIVSIHAKPIEIKCEDKSVYRGAGIVGDVEMSKKDFDKYLASNRYPRRSAEIWEDGHLSEVALLGRETPARPLRDTKFTRTGEKKVFNRPTTFAMVSPGSANTYVPDGSDEQEEYNKMPDMTMPDHEEDASIKKDLLAKYRMENDELKDKISKLEADMASMTTSDEEEEMEFEMPEMDEEMEENTYGDCPDDDEEKMEYQEEEEDEEMKQEFSKLRQSPSGTKLLRKYSKIKKQRNLYKKRLDAMANKVKKEKFNRALDKLATEGFVVKAHRDVMLSELMDSKDPVAKIKFWKATMKRIPVGKKLNAKNTRQKTKVNFSADQKKIASESAVKRIAQEGLDASQFQKVYQEELRNL